MKIELPPQANTVPNCFLSYSWDSLEHKDWVRGLAENLQRNGVAARLDQWDMNPGGNFIQYMESSVRDSDYVLLICTPKFCEKTNLRRGGVGYEGSIVTGELFATTGIQTKFIPILRDGDADSAVPSYARTLLYLDFRVDSSEAFDALIHHLYQVPVYTKPPLGDRPLFTVLKPALKPATKPATRPATKPALKPATKPALKPATKPALKPATKPTVKPATKSVRKLAPAVTRSPSQFDLSVFINCASGSQSILKTLVFTVHDCGFIARSVFEISDATSTRLDRVFAVISSCKYAVHEITPSVQKSGIPRLNNSFELGLWVGLQRTDRRPRSGLVLEGQAYNYQRSLSDIAGLEVYAHKNQSGSIINTVRDWLALAEPTIKIPAAASIAQRYRKFGAELPALCTRLGLKVSELTFSDYATVAVEWMKVHNSIR